MYQDISVISTCINTHIHYVITFWNLHCRQTYMSKEKCSNNCEANEICFPSFEILQLLVYILTTHQCYIEFSHLIKQWHLNIIITCTAIYNIASGRKAIKKYGVLYPITMGTDITLRRHDSQDSYIRPIWVSNTSTSLLNLFKIRPTGVVSKNIIGLARMLLTKWSWRALPA